MQPLFFYRGLDQWTQRRKKPPHSQQNKIRSKEKMELIELWNLVNTNPVLITILGIIATVCAIFCKKQKSEKEMEKKEAAQAQKKLAKQHAKTEKAEAKFKKEWQKEEVMKGAIENGTNSSNSET